MDTGNNSQPKRKRYSTVPEKSVINQSDRNSSRYINANNKYYYYISNDNQQIGPLNYGGICDLIRENTITRDTLIWCEGMANWDCVYNCSEFENKEVGSMGTNDLSGISTRKVEVSKDQVALHKGGTFMSNWEHESRFSTASGRNLPYVVMQVTLKEKFLGTGSKNLEDLETVINDQVAKGYRLHTMSTSNGGSKGWGGGDRIQATLVFERLDMR